MTNNQTKTPSKKAPAVKLVPDAVVPSVLPATTDSAEPKAVHTITQAAMDALMPELEAHFRTAKEREAMKASGIAFSAAEASSRQATLMHVAAASILGGYDADHANEGLDKALETFAAGRNSEADKLLAEKSLRTFVGQCKRAAHPNVREHVESVFTLSYDAWNAETAALKAGRDAVPAGKKFDPASVETPLRGAGFSGAYNMALDIMGAYQRDDDTTLVAAASDPVMYAQVKAGVMKRDPNAAAKALKRALEAITTIAAEFPSPQWDVVTRFLGNMKPAELQKLRDAKDAAERRANPLIAQRPQASQAPVKAPPATTPATPATPAAAAPSQADVLAAMQGMMQLVSNMVKPAS